MFRRDHDGGRYFVRIGRETREARNGVLRELLLRKGTIEPWDRQPCTLATISDLDLLVLRDALQRMGAFSPDLGVEPFLSETTQISPFVPPLCVREPLSGVLKPRNFAVLLFGRSVQRFVPGAFSLFSIYPGTDRSESHAERHELAGTLIEQALRLSALLEQQTATSFDKTDLQNPNAAKYPVRALREVMVNALAHRDYSLVDPVPPLGRNLWKARLLETINRGGDEGTQFETLARALPTASRDEIRVLLRDLRKAGQTHVRGITRAARWFPGQGRS